jgi:acid-sensing ion channel, other
VSNFSLAEDFKRAQPKFKSSENWTLQDGYDKKAKRQAYPRRGLTSGARGGIEMALIVKNSNFDFTCSRMSGFQFFIHTPGEFPNKRKYNFVLSLNKAAEVGVSPNMIKTSNSLKKYHPEKRQCFFENERYLKFFKSYTDNNCELECIANITLTKCGCVKHGMPRLTGTPICPYSKIKCCENAEDELYEDQNLFSDDAQSTSEICNCLPSCTSINYNAEVSQIPLNPEEFGFEIEDSSLLAVEFYFTGTSFVHMKRIEMYGWQDFIANCGGLLGLFLGISLVSIIEIFYYLSLRILVNSNLITLKRSDIIQVKTISNGIH